jgi:hypothetical protein
MVKTIKFGEKTYKFKKGIKQSYIFNQLYFEKFGKKLTVQEQDNVLSTDNLTIDNLVLYFQSGFMAANENFDETFDSVLDWLDSIDTEEVTKYIVDTEQVGNS